MYGDITNKSQVAIDAWLFLAVNLPKDVGEYGEQNSHYDEEEVDEDLAVGESLFEDESEWIRSYWVRKRYSIIRIRFKIENSITTHTIEF